MSASDGSAVLRGLAGCFALVLERGVDFLFAAVFVAARLAGKAGRLAGWVTVGDGAIAEARPSVEAGSRVDSFLIFLGTVLSKLVQIRLAARELFASGFLAKRLRDVQLFAYGGGRAAFFLPR